MKKYKEIILAVTLLFFFGCSTDDDQKTIIGTQNATLEITEEFENGDIVGELPGTSNKGSVLFSIVSQEPAGVLEILDADYGVLAVANAELLNAETTPELNLVVEVRKETVTENINVRVLVASGCKPIDLSLWNDNLEISLIRANEETPSTRVFQGVTGECNQLIISGENPLLLFCGDPRSSVLLEFTPSEESEEMGTITIDQDYICGSDTVKVTGSGTYDISSGVLSFDYDAAYQSGLMLANSISIRVAEPIICPQVDLSAWGRSVNISGGLVGSETDLGIDFMGMTQDCGVLNIRGVDPLGIGCSTIQSIMLTLVPSEADPTMGVVSFEQNYDCDGSVSTVQGTGDYNSITGSITIDYTVTRDSGTEDTGTVQITQNTDDCFDVDTSAWESGISIFGGSAGFQEDLGTEFTVTVSDCGVLTVEGVDPLGVACPNVQRIDLSLTPSATDPNEGTVGMAQLYTCDSFSIDAFSDEGSYDAIDRVIVLPYRLLFEGDSNPEDGIITIRGL